MADWFDPRSHRRWWPVLLAALVAAVAAVFPFSRPTPASAQENCIHNSDGSYTCRYTQLHNNNWPSSSNDPDCHDECVWYLHGSGSQNYPYLDLINVMNTPGVDFHGWMQRGVYDWSGLPYNSPSFYNCGCSNGQQFLSVGNLSYPYPNSNTTDTTTCGVGKPTSAWEAGGQQYDNHIVSSYADYNDQYSGRWVDQAFPADGQIHCSAAYTAYHEVGHAFGEGHSSVATDVMYSPAATTTIDGDAQQLLANLYGSNSPSSSSGGSGGCGNRCEMACPQISETTAADGLQTINSAVWTICGTSYTLPYVWGYYVKLWDSYQGVPLPTESGLLILIGAGGTCYPYFQSKQLLPWLNCVAPLK